MDGYTYNSTVLGKIQINLSFLENLYVLLIIFNLS